MVIIDELGLGTEACSRSESEIVFELFVVCLRNLTSWWCFLDTWVAGWAAIILSKPSVLSKTKGAVEVSPHPGPGLGLSVLPPDNVGKARLRGLSRRLPLQPLLCLYFQHMLPLVAPAAPGMAVQHGLGSPALGGLQVPLALTAPALEAPIPTLPSPAPGHGNCSPTSHLFKVEKYSSQLELLLRTHSPLIQPCTRHRYITPSM